MDIDTTRRTVAQARRMPAWQRLITTVHAAQEAKGYEGRQWGAQEVRYFRETLIGKPVELAANSWRTEFACYWVVRQVNEHSDGSESIRYALKAVYGDDLANVRTIDDAWAGGNDSAEDERLAREFITRAQHQTGVTR